MNRRELAGALHRVGGLLAEDNAAIGLVIDGRYSVERRLGRGGMGDVFLARDLRLDRPVAMKVLAQSISTERWSRRFAQEAHTLAKIEHPGIVAIHDLGSMPDGRLYYTMQFVDGATLQQLIAAKTDRGVLLDHLAAACAVVRAAHDRSIVHCDLKPANIMADKAGRVFVLDWGIARVLGELHDGVTGTPAYMPPEPTTGPAGDVYALGAILHHMATGRPPLRGIVRLEPADLDAICRKALDPNPARRYASVTDLGDDLRSFRKGRLVAARPAGIAARTVSRVRRRPLAAFALVCAVMLVAALASLLFRTSAGAAALNDAMKLIEAGRPAIEKAERAAYRRDADYADVVRSVDEGQKLIEAAIERAPTLALGHFLLGRAWEAKGWDDRAEACYRRTVELDPRFGPARYRLGKLLQARSHIVSIASNPVDYARRRPLIASLAAEAVKEIAAALALGGFDAEIERTIAETTVACAREEVEAVKRLANEGLRTFGNREGAEELHWLMSVMLNGDERLAALNRGLDIRPRHALALYDRALLMEKRGDRKRALADYGAAIRANPRFAEALNNRGNLLLADGDPDGAIADYDEVLRLRPAMTEALTNRGAARAAAGDSDGAMADLDQSLTLDPSSAEAHYNRAIQHGKRGDLGAAIADYDAAIKLNPRHWKAWNNRGNARRARGDADAGLADYEESIRIEPDYAEGRYSRGLNRAMRGQVKAAIEDYDVAIRANPRFVEALFARGNAKRAMGDSDGALADCDEAVRCGPENPDARTSRGNTRAARGDVIGALADYDEAIRLNPRNPEALASRGSIRLSRQDRRGAADDLQKALDVAPPNWPYRKQAEALLKAAQAGP